MPRLTISILILALSSHGVPARNLNAEEISYDVRPVESLAESAVSVAPAARVPAVATPPAPIAPPAISGNPLWAVPLTALSHTRERPIFSSSRRPPAAVVLVPAAKPMPIAPKPKDPERPKFTLVGTVASDHNRFGIFLDQSTKAALRLKMGDDYQGWKLRSVQRREATLEKDQETVILALPRPGASQSADALSQPGASQPADGVRSPLPNVGTLLSARRERPGH